METNVVDLTTSSRYPSSSSGQLFSDSDDEEAFGEDPSSRMLFKRTVLKLKRNDPNLGLLDLRGEQQLTYSMCAQIGKYLWSSTHVKNILLRDCGLDEFHIRYLFGKIAKQNETNQFIRRQNFLISMVANESSLVESIMGCLTSFQMLFNMDMSGNNFGADGLDVLVKGLLGSPIKTLDVSSCGIDDMSPLRGLQGFKRLRELFLSSNSIDVDDIPTFAVLLDDGYLRLRELRLQSCGLDDEFIGLISPILAKNTSLRYLNLHKDRDCMDLGEDNNIGELGMEALATSVHDSSSFRNTLASNHTIWKINIESDVGGYMFKVCRLNYCGGGGGKAEQNRIAWQKHILFLVSNEDSDMSPFVELDIKIIPYLLKKIQRRALYHGHDSYKDFALTVLFKMWACKIFRDRVEMASQLESLKARVQQLESAQVVLEQRNVNMEKENKRLKSIAQNEQSRSESKRVVVANGSIAERVKRRKNTRKVP